MQLCGRSGNLLCCDGEGCPHAYHPRCVGFAAPPVINGWLCPACSKLGRGDNKDPAAYKAFKHGAELLWVDSQLERPVSERMLAVDRRITGRNSSLFARFAAAAREGEASDTSPVTVASGKVGSSASSPNDNDFKKDSRRGRGRRRSGDKQGQTASDKNKRKGQDGSNQSQAGVATRVRLTARVSERQLLERRAERNWRQEGHELLGQRVRRYLGGGRVAHGRITSCELLVALGSSVVAVCHGERCRALIFRLE